MCYWIGLRDLISIVIEFLISASLHGILIAITILTLEIIITCSYCFSVGFGHGRESIIFLGKVG